MLELLFIQVFITNCEKTTFDPQSLKKLKQTAKYNHGDFIVLEEYICSIIDGLLLFWMILHTGQFIKFEPVIY